MPPIVAADRDSPSRHPGLEKIIFQHQTQNELHPGDPSSVCVAASPESRAASPVHNSNCNSTSSLQNQRVCSLAFIPRRTFKPEAARSRWNLSTSSRGSGRCSWSSHPRYRQNPGNHRGKHALHTGAFRHTDKILFKRSRDVPCSGSIK